ncbi:hypothetical protein PoB_002601000 [Plakobranchus ocellatus]|uniref:Uncharacterized protein n=1 Tax=Plakobranchus ocellatus TaxID=259542 RepID=A0AAV3ZXW6_9GAST|nr:hypothetical protein PoB_002601000 [Plakobranchus ocellatus]
MLSYKARIKLSLGSWREGNLERQHTVIRNIKKSIRLTASPYRKIPWSVEKRQAKEKHMRDKTSFRAIQIEFYDRSRCEIEGLWKETSRDACRAFHIALTHQFQFC